MTRVLVTGSTGRQGGAVARTLLAAGHEVDAYVRSPDSPAAASLWTAGARLTIGDLADAESLSAALTDVDAVFGLSIPFGAGGKEQEVAAGRILVDAASEKHLVYSSVRGGDRIAESGVDHADSKQIIEAYLRERATPATVLGPVYFMENALSVDFNGIRRGVFTTPLSRDKLLDQVAVQDIAAVAVHAIEHPTQMIGQRVDLASDSVSGEHAARVLSAVLGRELPYEVLPIATVREWAGEEIAVMFEAFEANDYFIDRASLRARFPEIRWHSFEDWARSVDWDAVLAAPPSW